MKIAECIKRPSPLGLVVIVALALGIFLRFVAFSSHFPLWVDETWTGAIVDQPTFLALLNQIRLDPNPPFYFLLLYFWTTYFGLSTFSMRLPSLIFGTLTPLIALLPSKALERNLRLLWCGLIALSSSGIWYSQEARCYSLAFLLATACTFAYVHLLMQPSMRTAAIWASLSSLLILTEYHSVVLVGCQGICYLAVHRERALRTWPAAFAFLPAAMWMAAHLPRVLQYFNPEVSILPIVTFRSLTEALGFVVGTWSIGALVLLATLSFSVLARDRNSCDLPAEVSKPPSNAWLAVGTAVVGAILVVAIGSLRPAFTPRYLMVFIPGILLGIALLLAHFGRRSKFAPVGVILIYFIPACAAISEDNPAIAKKLVWNFEFASRELEEAGIDQVIFLLDGPLTSVLQPIQLQGLGGFFFKRAGLTIPVTVTFLQPGENPNERLLALATTPRSAILWLYDLSKENTAAVSYSTRIDQINNAWTCKNFGTGNVGVLACHRK